VIARYSLQWEEAERLMLEYQMVVYEIFDMVMSVLGRDEQSALMVCGKSLKFEKLQF
jgi:hypothetical protein